MKVNFCILFSLIAMFTATSARCQAYEIRLVNKASNVLSVEMRETQGVSPKTTDFITDIVFGIKWKGDVDLSGNVVTSYNMKKSGVRVQKSSYYYQAFYSDPVGYNTPLNWQQNVWMELLSINLTGSSAGVFQLAEKGFDATTDPNFALNFVDYTPVLAGDAINVILPLNLTKFEATPVNKMVQLQWISEHEQNSKGFQVQRSEEKDLNEFKDIGWVNSKNAGTGTNEYAYMDKDVIAGTNYYYQLKQVDLDGQYKYSVIKSVLLDGLYNMAITIAPNPADKVLQIFFSEGVEKGNVLVKILDTRGAMVLSQNHYMSPGAKVDLNVTPLVPEVYILVIENKNGLLYKKIFKKG